MIFRSKQQPIEFSPGYWSEYVQVLELNQTTEEVTTEEDITEEEDNTIIFVVVGVVILVLGGVALVMLGFGYYKKR